jgi:hypothetical protein
MPVSTARALFQTSLGVEVPSTSSSSVEGY